ncbi:hypothetical protein P9112_013102 [Eukaryota sp. TZLM1-RC]
MCKSHRVDSFWEPLLSNLFDTENDFHENNRGDVTLPGLDESFIVLNVTSVDFSNRNFERLFWQKRIVLSFFKGMLKMVSDALLSLESHYERVAKHMEYIVIGSNTRTTL